MQVNIQVSGIRQLHTSYFPAVNLMEDLLFPAEATNAYRVSSQRRKPWFTRLTSRGSILFSGLHWTTEKMLGPAYWERGLKSTPLDHTGQTALHWAAVRGSLSAAEALLRSSADIQIRDCRGWALFLILPQFCIMKRFAAGPPIMNWSLSFLSKQPT